MIRVMVADDNIDINNMSCKFLTKDKDIKIISQTTDGQETLIKYQELKPDLLLLDLEMPNINGLEIINRLSKDPNEKNKKNIIVISGKNEIRANLWNMSKIYMSLSKPVDFDLILHQIHDFIKDKELENREITEKEIVVFLHSINAKSHPKNISLLIKAIEIAYKNPFLLRNINDLYHYIGNEENINSNGVQWSIRNTVRNINKNIPDDKLQSIYHLPDFDRSITPTYFFDNTIKYFQQK